MDRHPIRTGLHKFRREHINRFDHQMRVERLVAVFPQRFHDHWPEGDVGHEPAIHYVQMQPIRASVRNSSGVSAQVCKICSEQ